jgi:hypothetical protein
MHPLGYGCAVKEREEKGKGILEMLEDGRKKRCEDL